MSIELSTETVTNVDELLAEVLGKKADEAEAAQVEIGRAHV